MVITFDEPLLAGPLVAGNWSVCQGNQQLPVLSALATGSTVQLQLGPPGLPCGTNGVSFSPPPFDVTSLATGFRAEAFTHFPIT